jgi:hypothetical protein
MAMIYAIDYFGFVYKWFDRKKNMYYLGSHHGPIDDGYICSSKRMYAAYKKRPDDFFREIVSYNPIDDCKNTLALEQACLDEVENIKDNILYYNKKNEANGGWSFISESHISKRAVTLKKKHEIDGLSDAERLSYKTKIETRLKRISIAGFTSKEKEQHAKYAYQVKVIDINGNENIFDSCGLATRTLGIDIQYGLKVCRTKDNFKGYKIIKLRDPIIDCR